MKEQEFKKLLKEKKHVYASFKSERTTEQLVVVRITKKEALRLFKKHGLIIDTGWVSSLFLDFE